jgi:hypothetical protein
MDFERTYKIRISAQQCRTVLRLDLSYNYNGVIKSEINENHFQFKNLAVNTGSVFQPNLPQIVSIRLTENADNTTAININSSPYARVADNKIAAWQNALEKLIGIVWTDICIAAESRYKNVSYTDSHSDAGANRSDLSNPVQSAANYPNYNGGYNNDCTQQYPPPKNNKKIWINIIAAAAVIVLAIIIISQCGKGGANGGGKNKDDRAVSCATSLIADRLKDPDSISVNEAKIIDKDDYYRYIVYLDYTATNGFGGRVRNACYVCVRLGDGDTYYFNRVLYYVESANLVEALKSANGWGKDPDSNSGV